MSALHVKHTQTVATYRCQQTNSEIDIVLLRMNTGEEVFTCRTHRKDGTQGNAVSGVRWATYSEALAEAMEEGLSPSI